MTHFNPRGEPCDCGFGERLKLREQRVGSTKQGETDLKPYEAKMWHGTERGLLRSVQTPFWTTSHRPEAESLGPVQHPVSVRFTHPIHFFGSMPMDAVEQAKARGNDGIVTHFSGDIRDPSDPYPKREWAIALDPGAIVPGHDPTAFG